MPGDVGLGTRGAGVTSGMYDWSWRRLAPLMLVMRVTVQAQDFCLKVLHECISDMTMNSGMNSEHFKYATPLGVLF